MGIAILAAFGAVLTFPFRGRAGTWNRGPFGDVTVQARISMRLNPAPHPTSGGRCTVEQGPRFPGMRPWNRP